MLYDRPYMRQAPEPATKQRSVVTTLLVATIAVFVLQQMLNVFLPGVGGRSNGFLTEWFALSGQNFKELKVWAVLSYGFLHSPQSIMHIVGNMFGLYFIGRILEPILGKPQFLLLYLGGALFGGLSYLTFHFNDTQPVIGASAAVFALVSFFCLRFPERPITLLIFFVIPVTLKPKWLFWGSLAISVFGTFLYELPGKSYVAHSAHLGGIIGGIIYFRYIFNAPVFSRSEASRPSIELPEWFKRKRTAKRQMSYRVNQTKPTDLQKEVDRILDKINSTSFGSLTESEKGTLTRAKDLLNK
jgi:membrane associated rhomboid family serine protease